MSKIAEKRVRELGYFKDPFNRPEFTANDIFDCGVECYDQAMQDLLEKAEKWLKDNSKKYVVCYEDGYSHYAYNSMIEDFKNYMQNE